MFCSKCGKELPENEKFCSECGNPVNDDQNQQKFDVSDFKGSFNRAVSNAKESWAAMGQKRVLLAIIGALLVVCMLWFRCEIASISMGSMGALMGGMGDMPDEVGDILNGISVSIDGSLLLGGFMNFLVTVVYLVGIGAIVHPFVTNTAVTKKHLLIAKLAPVVNLGAFAWKLLFGGSGGGMGEAGMAEMMKFLDLGLSGLAWLLLGCMIAIWVLCFKVEKEFRETT